MSSNPTFGSPTLNYVGSVDLSTSTSGNTMYTILFDASLSTIGNVLMFEYKIQPQNVVNPDPANVILGYINTENAVFPSGITNQWTISVPASDHVYDPAIPQKIAVRVYSGLVGSNEISVSQWSNSLDIHNPPNKPVIYKAFYDPSSVGDLDDLWVFLTPDETIDYTQVEFIVAYYFKNASGVTLWQVSDPLTADATYIGPDLYYRLQVADFGNVTDDPYYQVVYTAVYAVYKFTYNSNNYYSVSEISGTFEAPEAAPYNAPTITGINYQVYTSPHTSQDMIISWDAPANSAIPSFTVARYILQKETNNSGIWVDVSTNISPEPPLQYTYTNTDGCNTNLNFRMQAVTQTGTESSYSNEKDINVFYYSTAPIDLLLVDTNYNIDDTIDISISFENPVNIGCGAPIRFVVMIDDGTYPIIQYVTYDADAPIYNENYNNLAYGRSGTITVYLETQDTNPPFAARDGASSQIPYLAVNFDLNPVNYQVYVDPNSQDMILSWSNPTLDVVGWDVISYDIYRIVNGTLPAELIGSVDNDTFTFTYTNTYGCNTNLQFYIVANIQQGSSNLTAQSNIQSINVFKFAQAPSNVGVSNVVVTSYTTMNVTVNFSTPPSYSPGCGTNPLWSIEVYDLEDNLLGSTTTAYLTPPRGYSVVVNNATYAAEGYVKVFLVTKDTNSSALLSGLAATANFIGSPLTLNPVDYKVYNAPYTSQNMVLTWNAFYYGTGWTLVNYQVFLSINGSSRILLTTTNDTTYTYDASLRSCGDNLVFQVVATVTNGVIQNTVNSNTQSINIFKFADAPTTLKVTNTNKISSSNMNISIEFTTSGSWSPGCGNPLFWQIYVFNAAGNNIASEITPYKSILSTYNVNINNIPYNDEGQIQVFLVTRDTNSLNPKSGFSTSTPFIAVPLTLKPIEYMVYSDPTSQIMNLNWNNVVANTSWGLSQYDILVNGQFVASTTDNFYTFNASAYPCGTNLSFNILAKVYNNSVNYNIMSNPQPIKIFKYADAPTTVTVQSAQKSGSSMNLSIQYTTSGSWSPGCGVPQGWQIDVFNAAGIKIASTIKPYGTSPYNATINCPYFSNGTVQVFLITTNTNPPSNPIPGAAKSAPYIAAPLVLNPVFYEVYSNPASQVMDLSWNNVVAGTPWTLTEYNVYMNGDLLTSTTNNFYNVDVSAYPCNTTLNFVITAEVTNNGTNYIITSNDQSQNIFKYPEAPSSVTVNWAAADPSYVYMDINAEFTIPNPYNTGCGNVQYFTAEVRDLSNNLLATQNILYTPIPPSRTYLINFNNVAYRLAGSVSVFLVTQDTNAPKANLNGPASTGYFYAETVPIFTKFDVTPGRTELSFSVVSQGSLGLVQRITWVDPVTLQLLEKILYSVPSMVQPGVTVTQTFGANSERIYEFVVQPAFYGEPAIPLHTRAFASNNVGIGLSIQR